MRFSNLLDVACIFFQDIKWLNEYEITFNMSEMSAEGHKGFQRFVEKLGLFYGPCNLRDKHGNPAKFMKIL